MMDSRELRLGNYVGLSTNGTSLKTFHAGLETYEVISIMQTYISLKGVDYPLSESHGCSFAKPIPLTEEWLVRMGFEKYSDGGELKGIDCFYCKGKLKGAISLPNFMFNGFIQIKHVHQLQNLYFALTGEELTIKSN